MNIFPVGKVWDFMKNRNLFMGISILAMIGSVVVLIYPGPRLGTDFVGGTEVELAFEKEVTPSQIRAAVTAGGLSSPDVIRVEDPKNPHRYLIRVQDVSEVPPETVELIEKKLCLGDAANDCPVGATEVKVSPGGEKITARFEALPDLNWVRERLTGISGIVLKKGESNPSVQNARDFRVEIALESRGDQLMAALRKGLPEGSVPSEALRTEWIGPKAGKQLRDSALKSIALALIFITAYVAIRFDLRFAPGGVLALMHDAIVTLGILTVCGYELNLTTVAAILTIIGFSINDTVVVYDRVRENMSKLRGSSMYHLINVSLSETMSRTIITSGTAILALLCFFIWGTGVLKEFALTLIIGMLAGVYSSIYVALPLTEILDKKFFAQGKGGSKKGPAAA